MLSSRKTLPGWNVFRKQIALLLIEFTVLYNHIICPQAADASKMCVHVYFALQQIQREAKRGQGLFSYERFYFRTLFKGYIIERTFHTIFPL